MPPIFGGKSLVTRRCFIGSPGRWARGQPARLAPPGCRRPPPGRPGRRGPGGDRPTAACARSIGIVVAEVAAERRRRRRDRAAGPCCPARAGRCAAATADPGPRCTSAHSGRGSTRRPPPGAPAAGPRRRPRPRHRRPGRGIVDRRSRRARPVQPDVGRADLLAVVAAVDAVSQRLTVLASERPGLLDQPGQAAVGIHHARGDDGRRRAAVEAAAARPAAVWHATSRVGGSGAVVTTQPRTNQEPWPPPSSRLAFLPNQPMPAW